MTKNLCQLVMTIQTDKLTKIFVKSVNHVNNKRNYVTT